MSNNVFNSSRRHVSKKPNAVPFEERMNHEVLIDLFRGVCKHYGISHRSVAITAGFDYGYVKEALKKSQYFSRTAFVTMCQTLKLMIRHKQRIRARQLIIPL